MRRCFWEWLGRLGGGWRRGEAELRVEKGGEKRKAKSLHGEHRGRRARREEGEEFKSAGVNVGDCAAIPPLRGPTRHKSARKKKSGRSGRDDSSWNRNRRGIHRTEGVRCKTVTRSADFAWNDGFWCGAASAEFGEGLTPEGVRYRAGD